MKCVFCDSTASERKDFDTGSFTIDCPNCGSYAISDVAHDDLPALFKDRSVNLPPRHLYSGWIRENAEKGLVTPLITTKNIADLLDPGRIPKSIGFQMDIALQYLSRRTSFYGEAVEVPIAMTSVAYAKNPMELKALLRALKEQGYILVEDSTNQSWAVSLTVSGIEKIEYLSRNRTTSRKAFVAIWFTDEMDSVYSSAIRPAVAAAGFDALVIKDKQHNNDINSEIIAEIKESKFLVAELTGQRGGVYFEAGFAYGMGIPVIWTCRSDWFNTEVTEKCIGIVEGIKKECEIVQLRRTHFDVEHFPFIIWESTDELYEKLYNRIRATIEV